MLSDEIMGYMLQHAYQKGTILKTEPPEIKSDITEKEAMEIFHEILDVYKNHNVSYQCACRISLALNEAMLTGAIELYNQEH